MNLSDCFLYKLVISILSICILTYSLTTYNLYILQDSKYKMNLYSSCEEPPASSTLHNYTAISWQFTGVPDTEQDLTLLSTVPIGYVPVL